MHMDGWMGQQWFYAVASVVDLDTSHVSKCFSIKPTNVLEVFVGVFSFQREF